MPYAVTEIARFDEPWAMAFVPGSTVALVTEKNGRLRLWQSGTQPRDVAGVPEVAHGGQGGLGDVAVSPGFSQDRLVYLSWAEAGPDDTRGAVLGRARLVDDGRNARLEGLEVIWRQAPKVTGRGHYSHRIAFSPDGRWLFVASGDRQKMQPAQDPASDLGKILRIPQDAAGRIAGAAEHYSLGHRNILGLAFDGDGRLWALEHGPRGGDELNLVRQGANYGWPVVSQGDHYDGKTIPRHTARPEFAAPAASWNPVIAPGGMIFYQGDRFPAWKGQALIAAMKPGGLVSVALEDDKARETARYRLDRRIRAIAEHEDGSVWLLEDGVDARLLRLEPARR